MAPSMSSLSPAAPAYIPKRDAPRIPPPQPAPRLVTYICMPAPLPPPELLPCPPPEFLTFPPLAPPPPPPLPCWGAAFHGGVAPCVCGPGPAPDAWPARRHRLDAPRMQRAAPPALTAASCGGKAAADAKEAATNQPSPRSVLAVTSPPISPTTSLPSSCTYQLVLAAPPPATTGLASAAAPSPAEGPVAVRRPPHRPRRRLRGGSRRARHPPTVLVRHTTKPRRLFDASSVLTSLMIRNIPNDFTRTRLMNILDQHCFIENEKIAPGGVRSEYDFLYLPIDFRTLANRGYAFVNMTSPEAARRVWEDFNGHRWPLKTTGKTCAIDYADRQGDELVKHFSGSRFDCNTVEYLPVRFEPPRDGTRPAEGAMHVLGRLGRPGARDGK